MVEVFKTDVKILQDANMLVGQIHRAFPRCRANFDLQDCDNILRIESIDEKICPAKVVSLLEALGFYSEILEDDKIVQHAGNNC